MKLNRQYRLFFAATVALFFSFLLTSCGGGGGGSAGYYVTVNLTASASEIHVGQAFYIAWSSENATSCEASGSTDWNGTVATSGTQWFAPTSAQTLNLALTCTGPKGSATRQVSITVNAEPLTTVANQVPIVVDKGPTGNEINLPYVSVTICRPGTSVCQTIDHILLDTGSYGLRVFGPGVINPSLALPSVTSASGKALAECAQFVSGYTWGSVNSADIKMANETASSVPIEIIGNSDSAFSSVPSDCSSAGVNIGSVQSFGANGVLGVGLFKEDCGTACVSQAIAGMYYECSGTSCSATKVSLDKQVANPVAFFAENNNGVTLALSSVPAGGAATLTGTLTFGVGTQSNNQLTGKTVYRADEYGNFKTTYKSQTYASSFLDSGSNGLFFPDSSIPKCSVSSDFFCPTSVLTLTAINSAYDDSASGQISFFIESVDNLGDVAAASIGGDTSTFGFKAFDWGLPFFFGRTVFVTVDGASTPGGSGPFWAY